MPAWTGRKLEEKLEEMQKNKVYKLLLILG